MPARGWLLGLGAFAFIVTTVAVALGATSGIDQRVLEIAQSIDDPLFDLAASIVGLFGNVEITGLIAIALALAWWRGKGRRGLVPLLLFAGVLIELAMKFVVTHPGPPGEVDRSVDLIPFLSAPSPFSFPSGHVFRATFLATILGPRASGAWRAALVALVGAMLLTRIYLGEHWFSDTLGGLFLGMALGGLALEIERR